MRNWALILTAAALIAAANTQAGEPRGPKHGHDSFVGPRIAERLSLSEDQNAKLQVLKDQFKKERDELIGARTGEGADLREQARAARESGDESKLRELREQRHEMAGPMKELRQKYVQKLRALLSEDQKKELDTLIEERKAKMAERRAEREGRGERERRGPGRE